MDLSYFKSQIEDEIHGYEDYKAKAEECPEFADTINDMAKQELGHAKNLLAMLKKHVDEGASIYKEFSERLQ